VKSILENGVADFIAKNGDNPITAKLMGLGNFNDQVSLRHSSGEQFLKAILR
jgi:hypothetical protein